MSLFAWKPEYSVGSPIIDEQHKKLFRMADELHNAMGQGHGQDHVNSLLSALIAYTCEHFATEERMMMASHYPGYAEHHREHEDLKRRAVEFQKKAHDRMVVFDLMQFLSDWLRTHIKGSDQKIATHIKNTGTRERELVAH